MKRIFTLVLSISITQLSFGQFLEDFDGYSNGDYLAQSSSAWTTWSGNTGGSDDVQVTNSKSNSGNNSIYFSSTSATGGPQDVVLPFGGEFNSGTFVFEQSMFVESNKGAYFNFQGEASLGNVWTLNGHFKQTGTMYITDGDNVTMVESTYPMNQWFDFRIEIDLNTNVWEVFLDNSSKGTYQNLVNQVSSLDLYPVNGSTFNGNNISGFYVDDCGFEHTPYILPNLNAGVSRIDLKKPILLGLNNEPSIQIRNLGKTTITSFDISVTYNGTTETRSISNQSLDSLETKDFKLGQFFNIVNSATSISATVSNVNGLGQDDNAGDDTKIIEFKSLEPAPGKLVVVEEATGTWCGWCPRGQVAMEFLNRDYKGVAQGIAVHNGDPMVNEVYDDGIGLMINGYPSAVVDRGPDTDPSGIWDQVDERLQEPPNALIEVGAKYDNATRRLDVSLTVDAEMDFSGDWRIACVLTEDSVTGTSSDYGQANYYSNSGDLIDIHGDNWRNKPSTVPASVMVYNHVARMISPSFDGATGSFPTSVTDGEQYIFNFEYELDSLWDADMMHIIGLFIDPEKSIDNAGAATIDEAISNGFVEGTIIEFTEELYGPDNKLKVFPNPTNIGYTNVLIDMNSEGDLMLEVFDQKGKVVQRMDQGKVNGPVQVSISTRELAEGIYFLRAILNDQVQIRKLIVQ